MSAIPARVGRSLFKGLHTFISRLKRLASFLHRARHNYRRYGPGIIVREIRSRIRQFPRTKFSYGILLQKFPDRFRLSPDAGLETIIDSTACAALDGLFKQLDLPVDAEHVLGLFKKTFGRGRTCRLLEDLFTFEAAIARSSQGEERPLVQASALPALKAAPSRRRILFVSAHFPSPYHGGGNRILNFIKYLSRGNDVFLAAAYSGRVDEEACQAVAPYCRSILKIPLWKYGGNQGEIRSFLGGKPADIVHYEWPRSLQNHDPAYGPVQIFTYMEAVSLRLLMDLQRAGSVSEAWLGTFAEMIASLRLELVDSAPLDARIAVTTKDADFFRKLDPYQEYTVLNHGLNLDEFSLPEVEPEPHTLVFVGNYFHYPNMDAMTWFFREIWERVRQEVPGVRIYLVGTTPPAELLALADGERIIVTGSVPDVRPYIQKAVLCIAPLISGAGMRGKVIEYAALRRTFVATSIAVTDLVFEEGRDYLHADDAGGFAEKVIALLKDPGHAAELGASAYETARQYYDTAMLVDYLNRVYARLERD